MLVPVSISDKNSHDGINQHPVKKFFAVRNELPNNVNKVIQVLKMRPRYIEVRVIPEDFEVVSIPLSDNEATYLYAINENKISYKCGVGNEVIRRGITFSLKESTNMFFQTIVSDNKKRCILFVSENSDVAECLREKYSSLPKVYGGKEIVLSVLAFGSSTVKKQFKKLDGYSEIIQDLIDLGLVTQHTKQVAINVYGRTCIRDIVDVSFPRKLNDNLLMAA